MDITSISSGNASQIEGSWVPATPMKPRQEELGPICKEMQENQKIQVNHIESEQLCQGNHLCHLSPLELNRFPCDVKEVAEFGEASFAESRINDDSISTYQNFSSMHSVEQNMPFRDLLALANAASGTTSALKPDDDGTNNAFVSMPSTQTEDGCSVHCWPSFDLNSPPQSIDAGLGRNTSSLIAPDTPGQVKGAKQAHISTTNLEVDERKNEARKRQEKEVAPDVIEIEIEKDQSDDVVSTQMQEKHNSDKGGNGSLVDIDTTSHQKPRRRRYTPKVVKEGQPKRTPKPRTPNPKTPKPIGPNDTPTSTGKRKYVRRKGLNNPQDTPSVDLTNRTTEAKTVDCTGRSCRKSLNFDSESQVIDESSSCSLPSDFNSESHAQNFSTNIQSSVQLGHREVEAYMSIPDNQAKAQAPSNPSNTGEERESLMVDVLNASTKGKCRIFFSDFTPDRESSILQMINSNSHSAPRSPNDSNCSTSACLTSDKQARGVKRKHSSAAAEELCSINATGAHFNSMQSYMAVFSADQSGNSRGPGMYFPPIHKKKRTEKWHNSVPSITLPTVVAAQNPVNQTDGALSFRSMLTVGKMETKKKRSKGPTRVRNLASLIEMVEAIQMPTFPICGATTSGIMQGCDISQQPYTCMEALAADTRAATRTKKRTKRNSISSLGSYPSIMHKDMFSIDALVEHLRLLDINVERQQVASPELNAFSQYSTMYQDQNALVVYQRDGTLIPFNPVKKRRPRPKVDLDDETTRVWKLLLQDINSEGIDGTNEEKEKWWEEERRVFSGRANSFIARMHLIQGDRRFSMWKGSVVDSVVGVFLTQNVSDHLSSSAYMSLAARFPLVLKSDHVPIPEEMTNNISAVKEPEACVLDLDDDTIEWNGVKSTQPAIDQISMTLQDVEYNEYREVVNSNESSVSSTGGVKPKDSSNCQLLDFANNGIRDQRQPEDVISSQNSVISSQNSMDSSIAQVTERSLSQANSEAEPVVPCRPNSFAGPTSFVELLQQIQETTKYNGVYNSEVSSTKTFELDEEFFVSEESRSSTESASQTTVQHIVTMDSHEASKSSDESNVVFESQTRSEAPKNNKVTSPMQEKSFQVEKLRDPDFLGEDAMTSKAKKGKIAVDWDKLRTEAQVNGVRERTPKTMDSVDWDAVRLAHVDDIAYTIRERGMNNMLAERIKAFLDRLVHEHGSIDLEWLRDVPPDKAKEYLLSFRGLGLKSVECVRLLTLHHLAFPVDTNVGRIAVRLGWVPLQPLPESLQLHLLEMYPVLESIQKYLWPRLCKLDQRTLYELHYQMITFGKVFCTKSKPNCNACPMRGECRHFASAFASARLALPAPEDKSIVTAGNNAANQSHVGMINRLELPVPQTIHELATRSEVRNCEPIIEVPASPEPIIEVPATPEPEITQTLEDEDIEDFFAEDTEEIPTIKLNIEEFTQTLQEYVQKNMVLQECDVSKALVALKPEAASIPTVKLKNVSRLRTEHQVYELPDTHPLLEGLDTREPDDPCKYLLAIWTPGETASSIAPPGQCSCQESGNLCNDQTCFACSSVREANSQTVRGTLLIPCRTAMRGSFPLNGTYFQVNEVFADHESSLNPIDVPRSWIWNLPRKTVFFGTSIPTIFKGLSTQEIQFCFWKGFVCVRGFDQKTRAPRPLMARLHFPASKLAKGKEKKNERKDE